MQDRHDLTDAQWARLAPLLPDRTPRRGGRWLDHRRVIDGVLWRTRCGLPWRDLPPQYGHWKSVYNRHRRWSGDGTWEEILDDLRRDAGIAEGAEWTVGWAAPSFARISTRPMLVTSRRPMSTRRSSPPRRSTQGAGSNYKKSSAKLNREALGRSRGGLTSKIHLAADTRCRPIARVTTAGHRHDSLAFETVMARIRILYWSKSRLLTLNWGLMPTRSIR